MMQSPYKLGYDDVVSKASRFASASTNSSHSTLLFWTSTIHRKTVLATPLRLMSTAYMVQARGNSQSEQEGEGHGIVVA